MKPALRHLLAKDWRRFRLTAAGFAGVLACKAALLAFLFQVHYYPGLEPEHIPFYLFQHLLESTGELMLIPALLMAFADQLYLAALVILLLQEDAPAGGGAFWRTRPVPGAKLAAAKLIFIALAAWPLPVAAQFAAHAIGGLPSATWTSGVASVIYENAAWAGYALVAATVLRRSMPALAAVIFLRIIIAVQVTMFALMYQDSTLPDAADAAVLVAERIAAVVVFIAGAAALVSACVRRPLLGGRFRLTVAD